VYKVMIPEESAVSSLAAIGENDRLGAPAQTTNEKPREVRPMLFDPSISHPYRDLDGTIPVIADV
jgi:hypothetical protein